MSGGSVDWVFFDPETDVLPEQVDPSALPGGGHGRIVVLAATASALVRSWAGWTAVALARGWAAQGLRIFLMDLGLEDPVLHRVLGVENEEGVSDAFLYNASVQKIARPALEGAIFFAPAGTASGDPEKVLAHPRWGDLVGGFSEADATLLLFLPTSTPGAEWILEQATDIVFLGTKQEDPAEHLGKEVVKVVAALGPQESSLEGFSELLPTTAEEPSGASLERDLLDPGVLQDADAYDIAEPSAWGGEAGPFELASMDTSGLLDPRGFDEPDGGPEAEDGTPSSDSLLADLVWEGAEFDGADGGGDSPQAVDDDFLLSGEFSSAFQAEEGNAADGPDLQPMFEADSPSGSDLVDAHPGAEVESGGQAPDPAQDMASEVFGEGPPTVDDALPGGGSETDPVDIPHSGRPSRPPDRRRSRSLPSASSPPRKAIPWGRLILGALALMALGGVAGTATGHINIPGLSFLRGLVDGLPRPELALEGPEAVDEPLGYSLHLFSYEEDELAFAREMQVVLESRLPNLLFSLVPRGSGDETGYLLLAGPAQTRSQAEALKATLAGILDREDPFEWSVLETPRAFFLGEGQSLGAARALLVTFEGEGIDPYILEVTYADGSKGYRVLAGAFADMGESRALQRVLLSVGIEDSPLIERRGRLPE